MPEYPCQESFWGGNCPEECSAYITCAICDGYLGCYEGDGERWLKKYARYIEKNMVLKNAWVCNECNLFLFTIKQLFLHYIKKAYYAPARLRRKMKRWCKKARKVVV